MIAILYAPFEQWEAAVLNDKLGLLPVALQQKIVRYKDKKDQQLRIMGKLLLAQLIEEFFPLKNYSLKNLTYDPLNKPYLIDGFYFSVAHADGMVVVTATLQGRVGIDIEKIKPIEVMLLREYFTDSEWQWLGARKFATPYFYFLWTRKEALLKADGKGVYENFKLIDVLNDELIYNAAQYYLREITLPIAGFTIALASSNLQPYACKEIIIV